MLITNKSMGYNPSCFTDRAVVHVRLLCRRYGGNIEHLLQGIVGLVLPVRVAYYLGTKHSTIPIPYLIRVACYASCQVPKRGKGPTAQMRQEHLHLRYQGGFLVCTSGSNVHLLQHLTTLCSNVQKKDPAYLQVHPFETQSPTSGRGTL